MRQCLQANKLLFVALLQYMFWQHCFETKGLNVSVFLHVTEAPSSCHNDAEYCRMPSSDFFLDISFAFTLSVCGGIF